MLVAGLRLSVEFGIIFPGDRDTEEHLYFRYI